jgi:alpha-N-arabinofuranosidase
MDFKAVSWTQGAITLPRVDGIAARARDGVLWLALTNLDPSGTVRVDAGVAGMNARSATAETLAAPRVDSINTFEAPATVTPKPLRTTVAAGRVVLELPPASVSVVAVRP